MAQLPSIVFQTPALLMRALEHLSSFPTYMTLYMLYVMAQIILKLRKQSFVHAIRASSWSSQYAFRHHQAIEGIRVAHMPGAMYGPFQVAQGPDSTFEAEIGFYR
jgi:hypothetical protein